MTNIKLDASVIKDKRKQLDNVAAQLKSEFFGLDQIIDKIIASVSAWYIFPQIITRPVIINLWGMTGVGKTHLVRRLVNLLDFEEKFAELQMNSGKNDSDYSRKSILNILSSSKIEEGQPGILLIDEMQRFKTVAEDGSDIQSDAYQDIWMLLSDGKFSASSSVFKDIEFLIAQQLYSQDQEEPEAPVSKKNKKNQPVNKFHIYPYEAQSIKKMLRLPNTVSEIMEWPVQRIMQIVEDIQTSRKDWTIDYTKLLIFISGNLDAAYSGSTSIEDCDTDADFYHNLTKGITVSSIKSVLLKKFRPEQISRFGNNHIIYPSLSKDSYTKLIARTCEKYLSDMNDITGIKFTLSKQALDIIYDNSVYPTQGTRPVFSAIHQIFSSPLIAAAMWGVENNYDVLDLDIDEDRRKLSISSLGKKSNFEVDVELEITDRKSKTSDEFKTYVSVHESAHALVLAVLKKVAPLEVKVNTASYKGGYVLQDVFDSGITSNKNLKDNMCIALAGAVAEKMFFGPEHCSTGSASDREKATELASAYVRLYGFGDMLSKQVPETFVGAENAYTDLSKSNEQIEELLLVQYHRAEEIIREHSDFLVTIVDELASRPVITQHEFIELAKPYMCLGKEESHEYIAKWEESKASLLEKKAYLHRVEENAGN
jgi:hypothetical protein